MPQMACPRCGAVFDSRESFRAHVRRCRGGEGGSGEDPSADLRCGRCGQLCSSAPALGAHAIACQGEPPD